jgi:glycosyltransferase involved in cell wall biosynthesis
MRIAVLAPIARRIPPRHYGPWERAVSLLTEGLVARGLDATLFATGDSTTKGKLHAICQKGYEEDHSTNPKVWESLHISELFERADEFDLIHNHYDFLPLSYSGLVTTPVVTTIYGSLSPSILPVYKKYNEKVFYVSISNADRAPELNYIATIYHGIDPGNCTFQSRPQDYLLFFGPIHHDKGTREAIEIAQACGKKLIIAGIIQDAGYFQQHVKPLIDNSKVVYAGSVDPGRRNELFGKAYAFLNPIRFNEPFSLSVIESMACGTPVIAFKHGSMPELIDHGKNGFLVSDKEAAIRAVDKIGDIDRAQCRKTVEARFTVGHMVENYISAYHQVLERTKREDHRPWGFYIILRDEETYKSKKIVVYPGKRLSLQRHQQRDEHWFILDGQAMVTLNSKKIKLNKGQSVDIPRGALHRIENIGSDDVAFIEVQTGDYFGEDDIERLEDDFGRT